MARAHLGANNYMIFHGLMSYGFKDEAGVLADRLFRMALEENSALREYYDAETGIGLGQTRFWGFTALYYGMELEWRCITMPPAWINPSRRS